MSNPGRLRDVMPDTAAFIDAMRETFGAEAINDIIAAGMAGKPCFHAVENGVEIGTMPEWDSTRAVKVGDMVLGDANLKKGKR